MLKNAHVHEDRQLYAIVERMAQNNKWPEPKLPTSYLVVDTETLGVRPLVDRMIQIGFCLVKDGRIDNSLWTGDYMSLTMKLDKECFTGAEEAVKVHGLSYEHCQEHGMEPKAVMEAACDILTYARNNNLMVVGHNFYRFDKGFIETEMGRYGLPCKFVEGEILDTAMLVKGMQINIMPDTNESNYAFWSRVSNMRCKGIYFNLDRYCMQRFDLVKYGATKDSAHDAGYDCYLTHLVMTEMNNILSEQRPK